MAVLQKPFDWRGTLPKLVTDADAFMAMRYGRLREEMPALFQTEEGFEMEFPGMAPAMIDLFHSLWSPEPELNSEVQPDRQYFAKLMSQLMATGAYAEVHAAAELSELRSILGTLGMAEAIAGLVPKKDKQQLQKIAQAQKEADDAEKSAEEAEAQAQSLQQVADQSGENGLQGEGQSDQSSELGSQSGQQGEGQGQQSSQSGNPSGQNGSSSPSQNGGKPGQSQGGNPLSEAAAQSLAEAQAARRKAEEAKAKAEELSNQLMGAPNTEEAEKKLRELARLGQAALAKAQKAVQDVKDTMDGWGLEESELTKQGLPEALSLLERLKKSELLKKFAKILGRFRHMAIGRAKADLKTEGQKVATLEYGSDLSRATTSELVALSQPALAIQARLRWASGTLTLHGQKTKKKAGMGGVIVCQDDSGSMSGEKALWAKAVALAMAEYAKVQSRDYAWMIFDTRVALSKIFPKGRISVSEKLAIFEARTGGGTDFVPPLRKAVEIIEKSGLKKADILFETDGICEVSEVDLKWLLAKKKLLEFRIYVVLCDVGETTDTSIHKFADDVVRVSSFDDTSARRVVDLFHKR